LGQAKAIEAKVEADRHGLPVGYTMQEADRFDDPELQALATAFALEDPRVGVLTQNDNEPLNHPGRAHLLYDPNGVPAGAYTRPLFRLNVSTFCRIRHLPEFPPVYLTRGHRKV
jgi:hypothetical protein